MPTSELYLLAMSLIFALPWLFWRLSGCDYYAPLVVVQIVAGILLGPGVLGQLYPAYYDFLFTPPVIQSLNGIAWWAVMLFVMIAGVELDLGAAWAHRRESTITAGLALGVPFCFGAVAAAILLTTPGWLGEQGSNWQFVLGIGMACAVTALPILILLMEKLEILRQPIGQRILRYASLDDIAIWSVLALILIDWERVGRQAGFLIAFVPVAMGYRAVMERLSESDRWFASLIWLASCGFVADWCGLHFMVGAFLSGAVTEQRWYNLERLDWLRHNVLLVIMPVFFLSTGLRTSWSVGGYAVFAAAALLLLASVGGKLAGVHVAGRVLGWPPREASVIGWLLQTKALIMIIFVNILLDKQLITSATFTALLLMAVMSTMLTIPVVSKHARSLAKLGGEGRTDAVASANAQEC